VLFATAVVTIVVLCVLVFWTEQDPDAVVASVLPTAGP
jgi:hypothetical protein